MENKKKSKGFSKTKRTRLNTKNEIAKRLTEIEAGLEKPGLTPEVKSLLEVEYAALIAKLNANKFNATKTFYNGVWYDSKREALFAELLDKNNIPYAIQFYITVMDAFVCHGKAYRREGLTVDFFVDGAYVVDTKGIITDSFRIKWKMLKSKYGDDFEYFTPKNLTEVKEVIDYLIKQRTI